MQFSDAKPKSFLMSLLWAGILLLAMGVIFTGVAAIMQLVPASPETMTVTVNGVSRPATADDVRNFRLAFLLAFGVIGVGMLAGGFAVIIRTLTRRAMARRLKESGVSVSALITDFEASNISAGSRFHRRPVLRLLCSYQTGGTTYIFKSGLLRRNPAPWLPDGMVTVYYDSEDIRRYFVDVDDSVRAHSDVVEL
jgi:hypothetical protein